jgi:nitroreductase
MVGASRASVPLSVTEADRLLTTTRAVRRRLDLDRPVETAVVLECLDVALQAPIASNREKRRFVVVTDPARRAAIGDLYRRTWHDLVGEELPAGVPEQLPIPPDEEPSAGRQRRILDGARRLSGAMDRVPVHVIAAVAGRPPADVLGPEASDFYGSVFPAVWSFQLALRARGLGSCLTTAPLRHAADLRPVIGLPDDVHPVAIIAVAHVTGADFQPAPRRRRDEIVRLDTWEPT